MKRSAVAKKLLKKYYMYRDSFGYAPRLARVHAYISVSSIGHGGTNLFVKNCYDLYNCRWWALVNRDTI